MLLLAVGHLAWAQNVSVSGALVGNGSYATLTGAFAAINGGAQTGAAITVSVLNDTWEGGGTAVLNAGTWSSLTVMPVGQPRSVEGATTAGQPLIDLAGADNVTLNGQLPGGVRGLTLRNTTVSAAPGTSTLRLHSDARYNTVTYCNLLGASQTNEVTAGGTVFFGAGSTTTGNRNNTLSYCDIGPAGTVLPTKAVFSHGHSVNFNAFNTIDHSHLHDYFSAGINSTGICLYEGNSHWQINHNRFYQSAHRLKTGSAFHRDILVNSVIGNNSHYLSHNVFGFANAAGTGQSSFESTFSNGAYFPIHFEMADDYLTSYIVNNQIAGITFPMADPQAKPMTFIAINGVSGQLVINDNTIGSSTQAQAISMTNLTVQTGTAVGIQLYTAHVGANASNNTIGGFTLDAPNGGGISFAGIRNQSPSTFSFSTVTDNQIGFAAAPIQINATGALGRAVGISILHSNAEIRDNIIAYISSQTSNPGSGVNAGVLGMYVNGIGSQDQIHDNRIYALQSTHPSAAVHVVGLFAENIEDNARNFVHSLSASSPDASLEGIHVLFGFPSAHRNNMVRLGRDHLGQSLTRCKRIIGIFEDFGRHQFLYNSVYVTGDSVSGADSTFAFYSNSGNWQCQWINNIFCNARSNGTGTGHHYAVYSSATGAPAGPTSNGNDFYVSGNGGRLGHFNGQSCLTLPAWRAVTGVDANSISGNPNFLQPDGDALTVNLHIGPVSPIESAGQPYAGISGDYDKQTRSGLTPVDIGADAGIFQVPQLPEIELWGNGLAIASGDTTPNAADSTAFGPDICDVGVPHQFVVQNTGNVPLLISAFSLSGPGAGHFSVATAPPGQVPPGQSGTFSLVFNGSAIGPVSAQFNLSSNDGNEAAYSFAIAGVGLGETVPPVAVCNPILLWLNAAGSGSLNLQALSAGSSDNCSIVTYTASPSAFNCAQLGAQAVQLLVADPSGLQATCSTAVVVIDTTRPAASCRTFSVPLDTNGQLSLAPMAFDNSSTDNCGIDSLWASAAQFDCSDLGINVVTLYVRDHSGNVGTCAAQLSVLDPVAPLVTCQAATLYLDAQGQASLSPAAVDASSSDNCGVATRSLSMGQFTCAALGVNTVTLTVADSSGNAAACQAQVTVLDTLAPDLVCAGLNLTVPDSGSMALTPSQVGTATDACGVASHQLSQAVFSCADVGSLPVVLSATDAQGNFDTCVVTVVVTATQLMAMASANMVGTCGYSLACHGQTNGSATVVPDGGCPPYTYLWSNGQTGATAIGLGAGTYTVTVQSADGQQVVRNVSVAGPPALSLALQTLTNSCPASTNGALIVAGTGGQSCQPYSYLWSNGIPSDYNVGIGPGAYTVTMTDAAGCTATLSATVSLVPQPSLTITENQGTLFAPPGFVAYQWFDPQSIIPGATTSQYTPSTSGLYGVLVTDSLGCDWISPSYAFTIVQVDPQSPFAGIGIYPNPGTGVYRFSLTRPVTEPVGVRVYDVSGRIVYAGAYPGLQGGEVLDLCGLAAGLYMVALRTDSGQSWRLRAVRE